MSPLISVNTAIVQVRDLVCVCVCTNNEIWKYKNEIEIIYSVGSSAVNLQTHTHIRTLSHFWEISAHIHNSEYATQSGNEEKN